MTDASKLSIMSCTSVPSHCILRSHKHEIFIAIFFLPVSRFRHPQLATPVSPALSRLQLSQSVVLPASPCAYDSKVCYHRNTFKMPSFSFSNTAGYYRYAQGVNAANLTMKDIKDANAKLDWFRQRRINDGLLKATHDDPGDKPPEPASSYVYHDYRNWRKKELKDSLVTRGINTEAELMSM